MRAVWIQYSMSSSSKVRYNLKTLPFCPASQRILNLVPELLPMYLGTRLSKCRTLFFIATLCINFTFPACSLPDTFQSWFLVAHLHVWLCLVRLKREGKDGSLVIREVVTTFWHDVEQRMRVLGVSCVGVESGNGSRRE